MDSTLVAVYVGILCAVMAAVLIWLIVQLVFQIKNRNKDKEKDVVELDGSLYRVVPIKKSERAETNEAVASDFAAANAPAADPRAQELAPALDPNEGTMIVDADAVVLKRGENVAYEEAYPMLSQEQKRFADEILDYADSREEEAKRVVRGKMASVYLGQKKLVQLYIKKGVVFAKLLVPNNELLAYADSSKLNIREKPIELKVDRPEMVGAVKDIIDLTHRNILEDRRRREEERKERRRQKRMEKKALENREAGEDASAALNSENEND